MITIVNYGSGNIMALANIYDRLNIPFRIASHPDEIKDSAKIILPGVGAFDETMSILDKSGFREVLDEEVLVKKTPVLGICVGMQILAQKSEEGKCAGLGWIGGNVKAIDKSWIESKPKLPHLGWNQAMPQKDTLLFKNIDPVLGFYFLHSFYFECENSADIMTTTHYGKTFASSVNNSNIYGVQFHPEKSHRNGETLLRNFAELIC